MSFLCYTNIGDLMLENLNDKIYNIVINVLCNNFIAKTYKLAKLEKILEVEGLEKLENIKLEYYKDEPRLLQNNEKFKEEIENFRKVLETNFNKKDLDNFYYNIEWVKIKDKKIENGISNGTYNKKTNSMVIFKNKSKTTIHHELFHMSASNTTLKNFIGGFCVSADKYVIGLALDEGYTELLANRYFNQEVYETLDFDSYLIEARVAYNLEKIVGKDKMQSLYLTSNLLGLINELKEYYTDKEIEQFLINLDVISIYQDNLLISEEENNRLNEVMEEIICFLVKGYSKILLKQNNSNERNIGLLNDYIQVVNIDYDRLYHDYEYDINKINEIINEILGIKLDSDVLKRNKTCYNK